MRYKIYLLLLISGIAFNCQAQRGQALYFETFIQKLKQAPIKRRAQLVDQYFTAIKSTPHIEGKNRVHFSWYGIAHKLEIEGDLQKAWATPELLTRIDCGERDFFYISYSIPADAIIEYRFIVDGKRSIDLKNRHVTQSFDYGNRNIFYMPGLQRSPYLNIRHDVEKGVTHTLVFESKDSLFSDRAIGVYIPYNYEKGKTYPVLYVHDGTWAMYLRPFINILDNLIYTHKIEPLVVVFIPFVDRWREYVTQSPEYARMIVEELAPFVESNLQMSPAVSRRGIIGASAGGHSAIVTAFRYPSFFENVASQGGGAGGYPGLNKLANEALDVYLKKKSISSLKNIYTEVGTYDLEFPDQKTRLIDGVRQFHERLEENKIDHIYKEVNSGHTSDSWDQRIDDILIQFYGT